MNPISRKEGFELLGYKDLDHLRRCCKVREDQAELAFVAGLRSRGYELAAEPGHRDERAGEGRGSPSSVQGEEEGTGATAGSSSSSPVSPPHDATKQGTGPAGKPERASNGRFKRAE